jgi:hypothetical protein
MGSARGGCRRSVSMEWSGGERPSRELAAILVRPYALAMDHATVRGEDNRGATMAQGNRARAQRMNDARDTDAERSAAARGDWHGSLCIPTLSSPTTRRCVATTWRGWSMSASSRTGGELRGTVRPLMEEAIIASRRNWHGLPAFPTLSALTARWCAATTQRGME